MLTIADGVPSIRVLHASCNEPGNGCSAEKGLSVGTESVADSGSWSEGAGRRTGGDFLSGWLDFESCDFSAMHQKVQVRCPIRTGSVIAQRFRAARDGDEVETTFYEFL
jgi:hypothetical protein